MISSARACLSLASCCRSSVVERDAFFAYIATANPVCAAWPVLVIPGRSLTVPEYHSTACLQRTSLGTLLLLVHRNLLRLSR